ncbi:MAG TPA: hypothetical protein VH477_15445 [Bryobacteraceae bacterium]|jgi:hypothetical protein
MDLPKIIGELVAERDRLDAAIIALERLKRSNANRPGRSRWKDLNQNAPEQAEDTPAPAASDLIS